MRDPAKPYENSAQHSKSNPALHAILWPHQTKTIFPNAPKSMQTRKTMAARIERIKKFRNRIFHHEPIWQNPSLQQIHTEICETAKWISPDAQQLLALSRVEKLLKKRPI